MRPDRWDVFTESSSLGKGCQRNYIFEGVSNKASRGDESCSKRNNYGHPTKRITCIKAARFWGRLCLHNVLQGNIRQNKYLLFKLDQQNLLRIIPSPHQTWQKDHSHPKGKWRGKSSLKVKNSVKNSRVAKRKGKNCCYVALFKNGRFEDGSPNAMLGKEKLDWRNKKCDEMFEFSGGVTEEGKIWCCELAVAKQIDWVGVYEDRADVLPEEVGSMIMRTNKL